MAEAITVPTMTMMTMTTIEEKKKVGLRHEYKHSINAREDRILAFRLRKLFPHDKNADSHGIYRVSSLYFDTPYDKALRQKTDGENRREKFRLRYYNRDLSFIRLEKKFKVGGLCGKYSAALTRQQAEDILRGKLDFLLASGDPLLTEFYSKVKGQLLRPRTVVVYDREAFLFEPGNVRITLDRNLRAGQRWADFLTPGQFGLDVGEGRTVLEVKYDEFLPEIAAMAVQVPNRQASACSKYALCRRYD